MLDREIGFTGPEPQNSAPMPAARAQGTIYHGGVLVKSGDVAEGLSLVRRGSEAFSATGARMLVPYHMALLAMASEIAGQIDEAMGGVKRCIADGRANGRALASSGAMSAQRPASGATRTGRRC